jgi:hypothetical protein
MILVLISISIFIVKGQEERVKSIMEPGPIFSPFFQTHISDIIDIWLDYN